MNKKVKLKLPQIQEWIYAESHSAGRKQDGLKSEVVRFHISELSQEEAFDYAELLKENFLKKYSEVIKQHEINPCS